MGLLGGYKRSATVRATVKTQTISLDAENFNHLLEMNAGLKESLADVVKGRLQENLSNQSSEEAGDVLEFLLQQGLGEATDVLLIDKALCVNCDNCEVACAETHDGTSRLNRQGGAIFAEVHVPTSCRHCEDPHCMTDCPPDAIQRAPGGEVFIGDNCIGCGNCERNCPYDVIQMAYPSTTKKNFWSDLLFGALFTSGANSEGKSLAATKAPDPIKQAVKCDMCKDLAGGPACVRACPTGAANRLSPEQFVNLVTDKRP
jgi:Fe-S-cluster-containing hydrogenase component 2